jgi:signal transduction histidine kinase
MSGLRRFIRNHVLWVGLAAVLPPLCCLLVLQYRSLAKLEKTSMIEYKSKMDGFVYSVQSEVKYFYKDQANVTFTTPADALSKSPTPKYDEIFGKCDVAGARKLFAASFNGKPAPTLYFYGPNEATRQTTPTADETRAVNVAVAGYKQLHETGAELRSPWFTSNEQDHSNPIIVKPLTDESRRVTGAVGMILDADYFANVLTPRVAREMLDKYYPGDAQKEFIVTIYDHSGKKNFVSQEGAGQKNETKLYFPHFTDWKVTIRSKHTTPEQWAHSNFNLNMGLTGLLTLALCGGIFLALRAAAREMRLSQMKADFVSNVSHELRTPLASIRVFGEFMKLGRVSDNDKIREYGTYIETESSRLTQLINNILDFSRIESGRKTYEFEQGDLHTLIATTLKTHAVQLEQNGFDVDFTQPARSLAPVRMDSDAIAQAFVNLLDNAVKYSGDSRRLAVKLDQKDGFARISVQDFGIGIPRAEQPKIFDKFYRVSTGLVHDVKGSGLGLSLVKHIVEAHQGQVKVISEPGQGSTFTISLPVVEESKTVATPETGATLGSNMELQYKQ